MLRITSPVALVGLLTSLAACGTQISETYDAPPVAAIMISNEQANEAWTVQIGTDAAVVKAEVCFLGADGNCATAKVQPASSTINGARKIFAMAQTITLPKASAGQIQMGLFLDDKLARKVVFEQGGGAGGSLVWTMVLMASDQASREAWIPVFDKARVKLTEMFTAAGVALANIQQLSLHPDKVTEKAANSSDPSKASDPVPEGQVRKTSVENFEKSVKAMASSQGPCLIHMTSHGSSGKNGGFNVGNENLDPSSLDATVAAGCGTRPTVILISACFSGLYLLDQYNLKKPNRAILTAARHDKTSFGCSADRDYTFWDKCLIEQLPNSATVSDLGKNIDECITEMEKGMGDRSFPQVFIGDQVKDLKLPGKA